MGAHFTNRLCMALILAGCLLAAGPVQALQCVPYAREASGFDLRGDAWKWWNAAAGAYERGHAPRLGAVVVFRKHGKMRLGHVAVVARLVDSHTILIDHANWGSRVTGRGRVSNMVAVRDVSIHNDWTEVQVWNSQTHDFGTQTYPTYGFIYPHGARMQPRANLTAGLPSEVEALLAAAPTVQSDVAAFDMAMEIRPLEAVPMPAVHVEAIEAGPVLRPMAAPAPRAKVSEWDGDKAAARRAGSSHY